MNKKILPINTNIALKAYNDIAFAGMVILSDEEKYMPYYLSHNSLLLYRKTENYDIFTVYKSIQFNHPNQFYFYYLINNHFSIEFNQQFIMNAIDDGYYIYTYYYPHDGIGVFGYDLNEKKFYISGYDTKDESLVKQIDFDELSKKMINKNDNSRTCMFKIVHENDVYYSNKAKMINGKDLYPDKSVTPCDFDKKLFLRTLDCFLNPANPNGVYIKNEEYGINAVRLFIEKSKQSVMDGNELDLRGFQIYHEYKELMKFRLNYMLENKIINNTNLLKLCEILHAQAKEAYALARKYNLLYNKSIGQSVIELMNHTARQEKEFLVKLRENIL